MSLALKCSECSRRWSWDDSNRGGHPAPLYCPKCRVRRQRRSAAFRTAPMRPLSDAERIKGRGLELLRLIAGPLRGEK